jgi:hypothetical protein
MQVLSSLVAQWPCIKLRRKPPTCENFYRRRRDQFAGIPYARPLPPSLLISASVYCPVFIL